MQTKHLITVAALMLLAGGCPGAPILAKVGAACGADTCTWTAESDGTIGQLELYVTETGGQGSDCGPQSRYPEDCGQWAEKHTAFSRTGQSATYGGDAFDLALVVVDSWADQVDNSGTLFDLRDAQLAPRLTVLVKMFDVNHNYVDCAVYGQAPSYFQSQCTNVRTGTPW